MGHHDPYAEIWGLLRDHAFTWYDVVVGLRAEVLLDWNESRIHFSSLKESFHKESRSGMAGVAFAIATTFFMERQCHATFLIAATAMPLILSWPWNICSLAVAMSRSRLSIPLVASIATVMIDAVWLEHEANDLWHTLPRPRFSKHIYDVLCLCNGRLATPLFSTFCRLCSSLHSKQKGSSSPVEVAESPGLMKLFSNI